MRAASPAAAAVGGALREGGERGSGGGGGPRMESSDLGGRQQGPIWHRKPCPAARRG